MAYLFEGFCLLFVLIVLTVLNASWWVIFEKAGQTGWGAIVPIWNLVLLIQITGKPLWWLVFFLVPCLNLAFPVFAILMIVGLAQRFGKGVGYSVGLILVPVVFVPLLAFSSAEYEMPAGA